MSSKNLKKFGILAEYRICLVIPAKAGIQHKIASADLASESPTGEGWQADTAILLFAL